MDILVCNYRKTIGGWTQITNEHVLFNFDEYIYIYIYIYAWSLRKNYIGYGIFVNWSLPVLFNKKSNFFFNKLFNHWSWCEKKSIKLYTFSNNSCLHYVHLVAIASSMDLNKLGINAFVTTTKKYDHNIKTSWYY
jgi:hypothetical protein